MVILGLPAIDRAFFFLIIARAVTRFVWRRRAAPSAPGTHPVEPDGGLEGPAPSPSSRARPEKEQLSLQAAIADHLTLKRRHEQTERLAGPPPIPAGSPGLIVRQR